MPTLRRLLALVLVGCLGLVALPLHAQGFTTTATGAYVVDHNSGQVLLDRNANMPMPPASMSKLMTLLMTFEALDQGRITLETRFSVSEHAMSFGGSTMFLNTQDRPTVDDLIRGVIIVSGNDASVVLAEGLSPDGTEEAFADLMTQRAREIGMDASVFRNASGWPAPGHVMSMHDLGLLAERIITEHPEFYLYFNETEFDYFNRAPDNRFNRNPLLGLGIGADGLKTGYTQEAGFGLVGSAVQGDRRVTFAITGLASAQARAAESERIVNWAFRQFVQRQIVTGGTELARAPVFMGRTTDVGLAPAEDLSLLLPVMMDGDVTAEVSFQGPLSAPIMAGDVVGELLVRIPGFDDRTVPMVATDTVERGGILTRLSTATRVILHRIMGDDPAAASS
jgi:D-alanyl-D-alanine carboxypeptidase (penicillin-binding protein 5/6)